MAHQNRVTHWVLQNKHSLHPIYTQFDWPGRYCPGLYDFELNIDLGGIKASGRGIDADSNLAIEKATCEALERWICKKLGISSVGFAVNGELSAGDHAKNELLERYLLRRQVDQGIALFRIPTDSRFSIEFSDLRDTFLKKSPGAKIDFFEIQSPTLLSCTLCRISAADDKKIAIGFSCSIHLERTLIKSFLEAIPNYAGIHEVISTEVPWHLAPEFIDKLDSLTKSNQIYLQKNDVALPDIKFTSIDLALFPELVGCPIVPTRVEFTSGGIV